MDFDRGINCPPNCEIYGLNHNRTFENPRSKAIINMANDVDPPNGGEEDTALLSSNTVSLQIREEIRT